MIPLLLVLSQSIGFGAIPQSTVRPATPAPVRIPGPNSGGSFILEFPTTTSKNELFWMQVPLRSLSDPTPVPLIVGFHSWGTSGLSIPVFTEFDTEANTRGWYLLAPMGGWQNNVSSTEAQQNIHEVLDWVVGTYNIDADRIYGVGFSMGGGTALNHAARKTGRFAAVVNHTGVTAQQHSWEDATMNPALRNAYMNRYGGTPLQVPFEYARCSVAPISLAFGPMGEILATAVDTTQDLARNLREIPIWSVRAQFEPGLELVAQNDSFATYMGLIGAQHTYTVIPGVNTHLWQTLDPVAACDWMALQSLQQPTSGDFLADADGQWFDFDVQQDAAGSFTRVVWDWNANMRALRITDTENLTSLSLDTAEFGVGDITLTLRPGDGTFDIVTMTGVPAAPQVVTRNGVAHQAWSYTAATQTLQLLEQDGTMLHNWFLDF